MTEEGFFYFVSRLFVKFLNKANLFNTTNLVKIIQLTRSSLSTSSIARTIVNTAILVNIIKLTWSTLNIDNLGKENTLIIKLLAAPVSKVAGMMM